VDGASQEPQADQPGLEQTVEIQALATELKPALIACLTGRESRRWTVGELFDRVSRLGMRCAKPAIVCALGELELEIALCPWLPWTLTEQGTEWSLVAKNEFLELLGGIRKVPGVAATTLSEEHKAVLLVVIGHRRKGGVSRTRISDILRLDASPYLDELRRRELIYAAPGKEFNWWRPTPQALLSLGLRSTSDVPELLELERWFESQRVFSSERESLLSVGPVLEKAVARQARRRRRELERRSSAPQSAEECMRDSLSPSPGSTPLPLD
jgi:chromosome segregation and condensation protein ScpB